MALAVAARVQSSLSLALLHHAVFRDTLVQQMGFTILEVSHGGTGSSALGPIYQASLITLQGVLLLYLLGGEPSGWPLLPARWREIT